MFKDLRFAARLLLKQRAFTAAALLTLALCIGANTAMFSVIDSILLKPLPFRDADRLVSVYNSYPRAGVERAGAAVPDFYDRQSLDAFETLALYREDGLTIGESGRPLRITGLEVTPSFFPLLGVKPELGRAFLPEEGEPGGEASVVLSWGLWQEQFAGAPDVVGRTLRVNDAPYTIVGVMPRGFLFADPEVAAWIPLAFTAEQRADDQRHSNSWQMIGRLRPGIPVAAAQAQIDQLNLRLQERVPQFNALLEQAGFHTVVHDYRAELTADVRDTLWLLQAGVLLVLLIGCVNIANLMLVRSTGRHRELATRSALGAGRHRLVRQLLTESLLLAGTGGALGVLLGWLALRGLAPFAAENLPRGTELALDGGTLLLALGISIAAGLLFGTIPVLRLLRSDLSAVFRDEGRTGTSGRGTQALRGGLVVAQVALAFALLIGAGLMIASFARTLSVEPGFEPEGVLTAAVALPVTRYPGDTARAQFSARLLESLRAIPGVRQATVASALPFSGGFNASVVTPENYVPDPSEAVVAPINTSVSDGYFETLGIRLVAGRTFTPSDGITGPPVLIIDRELAEHFFPGQDPLGRRMSRGVYGAGLDDELEFRTVVGIVESVRSQDLTGEQPLGQFYTPLAQEPGGRLLIAVSGERDPLALANPVRAAVTQLDPDLPVYDVRTLPERMSESLTTTRVRMALLAAFAALALGLAAVGLYGVLAYSVAQRAAEIGIRMALGSSTRAVFGTVLRQGARLIVIGLALGAAGSFALARALRSMLFGVAPTDPMVYLAVLAVLSVTALAACAVPAHRATRVDPMVAMRETA